MAEDISLILLEATSSLPHGNLLESPCNNKFSNIYSRQNVG